MDDFNYEEIENMSSDDVELMSPEQKQSLLRSIALFEYEIRGTRKKDDEKLFQLREHKLMALGQHKNSK